jgi:biopolymer transport protein ExbB/TolQ
MMSVLTGKALPYIATITVMIVAAMGLAIWMLMQERDSLNQMVGQLDQANKQQEQTIRDNAATYKALQAELQYREALVTRTRKSKQQAERKANEAINQLRKALHADACANTVHPAAVTDSLRTRSPADKDSD